jgi:hypothetical protein
MSQLQITKRRPAASTRRRAQEDEQSLPLDARDPDIVRAKRLQRQPRRTGTTR